MRLQDFPMLADENIHADVVSYLRAAGCNVASVREIGRIGEDDLTLIRFAFSERRVILTHDSDFGMWAIAEQEPLIGLVYLRPGHIEPRFTIATMETVFRHASEIDSPFVLIAKRTGDTVTIRVRRF